jgi:uncharacterized Zn finger protein (UPF0148 family)
MAETARDSDGRIRIRCNECGKRLKVPAGHPGKVFRCPICANTIISPLTQDTDEVKREEREAARVIRQTGWVPQIALQTRHKSLESLSHAVAREFQDLMQGLASILGRGPLKDNEAADRIQTLWREKSQRLRELAVKLTYDLDREVRELEMSPMRKQPSFIEKLNAKQRERRDLALVMKLVFNVTMPEVSSAQPMPSGPPIPPSPPAPVGPNGPPKPPAPNGTPKGPAPNGTPKSP